MSKDRRTQLALYVAPLVITGCGASQTLPQSATHASQSQAATTQPASEKGPFASPAFPLLGAVAAICLSDERERSRFSQSADPESFCVERYGLDESQAKLLMAPAANAEVPCSPDDAQVARVVGALRQELAGKAPAAARSGRLAGVDPNRLKRYPMVAALYRSYVLGDSQPPESWDAELTSELKQHPENIW